MAQDQFQYIRMPDGSYGKFKADATTEQIRAAVLKDFPNAYGAQPQRIADTATIGPKKTFSNITAPTPNAGFFGKIADKIGLTEAEKAGSQLFNATNPIEGYNAMGRAENPALSRLGDLTAGLKELLFGGQSAGKPKGTESGIVNNPVTIALSGLPGAEKMAASVSDRFLGLARKKNELLARLLRGPGAVGDIEGVPAIAKRELEPRIMRNEPIEAKGEMYEDLAKRKIQRGEEQAKLDTAHETRLTKTEAARQKELTAAEKLKEQDAAARMRRGGEESEGEGGGGPQGQPGQPGTGQDLITRTRALVKPGEPPSPADLKRAGDLTQAPLARLRTLAKFGDKLAENELNRRLKNVTFSAAGPLAASVPQLAQDGKVKYAHTSTESVSPMRGFPQTGANIESPSGKKISYFASAGSPKPPASGVLGEMAYDDKKGHLLAWNGSKWVEADDAARQEIRTKIADERAHLVGEFYKGGQLTKDQVMIFVKQKLIGTEDARRIVSGPQEEKRGQ